LTVAFATGYCIVAVKLRVEDSFLCIAFLAKDVEIASLFCYINVN